MLIIKYCNNKKKTNIHNTMDIQMDIGDLLFVISDSEPNSFVAVYTSYGDQTKLLFSKWIVLEEIENIIEKSIDLKDSNFENLSPDDLSDLFHLSFEEEYISVH